MVKHAKLQFDSHAYDTTFQVHQAFLPNFMETLINMLTTYETQIMKKRKEWFVTTCEPYTFKINSDLVILKNDLDNEILDFPFILLPFFFEIIKPAILALLNPTLTQFDILNKIQNSKNPNQTLQNIDENYGLFEFLKKENLEQHYSLENHFFFNVNHKMLMTWADLLKM